MAINSNCFFSVNDCWLQKSRDSSNHLQLIWRHLSIRRNERSKEQSKTRNVPVCNGTMNKYEKFYFYEWNIQSSGCGFGSKTASLRYKKRGRKNRTNDNDYRRKQSQKCDIEWQKQVRSHANVVCARRWQLIIRRMPLWIEYRSFSFIQMNILFRVINSATVGAAAAAIVHPLQTQSEKFFIFQMTFIAVFRYAVFLLCFTWIWCVDNRAAKQLTLTWNYVPEWSAV